MAIVLSSPVPTTGHWTTAPAPVSRVTRRQRWTRSLLVIAFASILLSTYWSSSHSHTVIVNTSQSGGGYLSSVIQATQKAMGRRPTVPSRGYEDLHHDLGRFAPRTSVLAHTPGCTTLDNLYVWNGTMYLVTDDASSLPQLFHINSGWHTMHFNGNMFDDPQYIQAISPSDALQLFGAHATRQSGVTMMMKDIYLQHYAHFTMESILTLWTTYAAGASPDGRAPLPFPERMVFTELNDPDWRDGSVKMNGFVLKHAFPGMGVQYKRDWEEKAEFGTVDVYDRVVLLDRPATHFSASNAASNKILAAIAALPRGRNFWEPVRNSMLASLPLPQKAKDERKLVVTYVSRQHAAKGRRLAVEDNARLEAALKALEPEFEVNLVYFEEHDRAEQIQIAARSDILLGLHGNGLTHLLWLGKQSLVIEMMLAGGWARDFELPASTLGHHYVAIHNDTLIRGSEMAPTMVIPEGFHGQGINVQPEPILAAIRAFQAGRKAGKEPVFPPHRTSFRHGSTAW